MHSLKFQSISKQVFSRLSKWKRYVFLQIVGDFRSVQDAVFHVTGRLRDNLFPNKTINGAGPGSYSFSTGPDISPYEGLREPLSPVQYPSFGLSRNTDRQNTFTQGMDHLGFTHSLDRPRSPPLWAPQVTF